MAVAEPADFVHVYDVKSGYENEQEIDFFGEISGISFVRTLSPCSLGSGIALMVAFLSMAGDGIMHTLIHLLEYSRNKK